MEFNATNVLGLTTLALLTLTFLTRWIRYLKIRAMLEGVPGPRRSLFPALNIIGNVHFMRQFSSDPSTAFYEMRRMYRNRYKEEGIYVLWSSIGIPIVHVFRADLIEQVVKSPEFATKSIGYDALEPWLGKGLLTSAGSHWKAQRRMLTPSFHFAILDQYEETMNEHSLRIVKDMRNDPDGSKTKNIELSQWATDYTMAVLLETVMGLEAQSGTSDSNKSGALQYDSIAAASREYINGINKTATLLSRRFLKLWNKWDFIYYKTSEGKEFMESVSKLHEFSARVIKSKIEEFRQDPSRMQPRAGKKQPFMDMLVAMHLQGEQISVQEMKEQAATFMFAGYDTTGWGIAWILYQLGIHTEVQAKVHEELDLIFGEDRERHATPEDLKQLRYFDCVIKECQRMYGSVPFISRRCTVDGAKLGNYRIPRDSTISIAMHFLHRDPAVFPQPERFDPDRFLPENVRGRHPYAFMPFSAGPRNCIGQKFALQELKIALVNIFRSFRVRSRGSLEDLCLAGELILRAKNGLHVDFEQR